MNTIDQNKYANENKFEDCFFFMSTACNNCSTNSLKNPALKTKKSMILVHTKSTILILKN